MKCASVVEEYGVRKEGEAGVVGWGPDFLTKHRGWCSVCVQVLVLPGHPSKVTHANVITSLS